MAPSRDKKVRYQICERTGGEKACRHEWSITDAVCVTEACDSPTADVLLAAKATFYRKLGAAVPKDTAAKTFSRICLFSGLKHTFTLYNMTVIKKYMEKITHSH